MPLADYQCDCGFWVADHYFPSAVGATASAPRCPACSIPLHWLPNVQAMDAKEPFQRFAVTRQVQTHAGMVQQQEVIDSTHRLRQLEKDSEQRYRNGEGEPLRFRAWSQDHSNRDVGSFGTEGQIGDRAYDSGKAPTKKANIQTRRHGGQAPRRATGPGVARGGVTALKTP
jgi:hypothetical protein